MHGIGLTKHGRYPRKLEDEMGIQRKRAFQVNHHGLSKGFEELAVPSNKETLLIEYQEMRQKAQADGIKA